MSRVVRLGMIAFVCTAATVAAGEAAIMSFGDDSGAPGDGVRFSLSIDPDELVTNFRCTLRYDPSLLILQDISLSDGAWDNGIFRLWYDETSPGRVEIETESDCYYWPDYISRLAILEFDISDSAYSTTTPVRFAGTPQWEYDCEGYWNDASPQDGAVTIVAPGPTPTPRPHGKHPEVNLRMESTAVYVRGEEPIVRCTIVAHDWAGYPEDAYLAVAVAGGGILYRDARGNLSVNPTPVVKRLRVENLTAPVGFGVIPETAPLGLYTIYGTLCRPGKDPTRESNRISNLESAQFEVMEPPATPTP